VSDIVFGYNLFHLFETLFYSQDFSAISHYKTVVLAFKGQFIHEYLISVEILRLWLSKFRRTMERC